MYTRSPHATIGSKSKFLETSDHPMEMCNNDFEALNYILQAVVHREKWTKIENKVQYAGRSIGFHSTIFYRLVQVKKIIISVRFLVSSRRCIYHAASSVMDRFFFCFVFLYSFILYLWLNRLTANIRNKLTEDK